jgi:serine/threonine protein kinase
MADLRLVKGGVDDPAPDQTTAFSQTAVMKRDTLAQTRSPAGAIANIDAIEPGTTLGHYLVMSKIGEGGMGVVYKAHDTTLDRTVALKVLSPQLFRNQEFLQRFRIEAQAQARLNGPNIVTLHSMFEIAGSLVLVMEYIEGSTLAQRIHNEGHLSVATTVWVFEQALVGVERAHRMGIVHRDLKPSNIFITSTHEIKLMDFGVAKIMDTKEVTQSGSMIGTLMYISPEQIKGKEADFRSDIYTLGVTLFEAVTGRLPFEKKTDYEYMDAHLHEAPPQPLSLRPDIPQDLETVILKAIEKDPEKRFQNAHEFRSALIKLGMIHVRAYRRLKTIRKDRDRAVFGQYSSASPVNLDTPSTNMMGGFPGAARWLETWKPRLRRVALIGLAGLLPVALGALALGYYLAKPTIGEMPVAVAPADGAEPGGAPLAEAGMAASTPDVAASPDPSVVITPPPTRVEPAPPAQSATTSAPSKPRAVRRKDPAPANAPQDDKYKALRKAWGG